MKKQLTILLMIVSVMFNYSVLVEQAYADTNVGGNISTDTTWTLVDSPYIVTDTVQVLENVKLTIEPGVVVKFNTSTGLNITGELIAIGTESQNIIFTSNQSTPQAGDWGNIIFNTSATGSNFDSNNNYINGSIIKYTKITYAGGWDGKPSINSIKSSLFIDNNIFEYNSGGAILVHNRSIITNNTIRNNGPSLTNPLDDYYAIKLFFNNIPSTEIKYSLINGNNITGNAGGIMLSNWTNVYVTNNTITNNRSGIFIGGTNLKIIKNIITNNYWHGVWYGASYTMSSSGNIIQYNNIKNNRTGIVLKDYDDSSNFVDITKNNIYNNINKDFTNKLSCNADINIPNNYWGTIDSVVIDTNIEDYYDYTDMWPLLGKVNYISFETTELNFTDVVTPTFPIITPTFTPTCTSWTYSDWSACQSDETKSRTITSSSPNDCFGGNPILTQSCEYTLPVCTSWTYSDWGTCTNGQQTRAITSSQPANCAGGNPILNQSCDSTPLCEENNWTSTLSPIICPSNGQQTKTWSKIGQCQEGISHPAEEAVSCNYQTSTCTDFTYSDWGSCSSSGAQSRTIFSSSPSGCVGGNSVLNQSCAVQSTTCASWTYSDWGSCANSWQTRTIASSSPSNCINGNPVLSQSCQNETNNEDDAETVTEPEAENTTQSEPEASESNSEETSTTISDGDIIQCQNSSNPSAVYIVKIIGDTKYIRHIVSLDIFNYYTHLKWGNLKQIDSLGDYSLSGWVRYNTGPNGMAGPNDKVYEINGDQTRHWINMTAEDFLSHGGSEPAIFNINQGELNLYTTGADVMAL